MRTLATCEIGEEVLVDSVLPSNIASKLLEMGFYEGKKINVLYKAPFGDPIAVQVGNYVLSMRKAEAKYIVVTSSLHDH